MGSPKRPTRPSSPQCPECLECPLQSCVFELPGRPTGAQLPYEALRRESARPGLSGPRQPPRKRALGPSPLSRLASYALPGRVSVLPAALGLPKGAEAACASSRWASLGHSAQRRLLARFTQRQLVRCKSASDQLSWPEECLRARAHTL